MKYFGFLARFVVLPLLALRLLIWWDRQRGKDMPNELQSWHEDAVLLAHVAVAVTYTTPWDNYLVANRVWWYDPELVTGHTIGYVPIEEYSFFVLQTLLSGSLTAYLARRIPAQPAGNSNHPIARFAVTSALGGVWAWSTLNLIQDRKNYLYLILSWALPPIMLQTGYGGDILWRHRKLIATSILTTTSYLGATDSLAIESGTWTINDDHTTGVKAISKHLPFEELLFFFVTNVLLVFGVTLVGSKESEKRLPQSLRAPYFNFKQRMTGNKQSDNSQLQDNR